MAQCHRYVILRSEREFISSSEKVIASSLKKKISNFVLDFFSSGNQETIFNKTFVILRICTLHMTNIIFLKSRYFSIKLNLNFHKLNLNPQAKSKFPQAIKQTILIQIRKYSYIGKILRCDLKHLDHKNFLFKLKGKS